MNSVPTSVMIRRGEPKPFRPGAGLGLLLLIGVWGCGANVDPGSDSTTHFWRTCAADAECGRGGSCICGRCSLECEFDEQCLAYDARCVPATQALACDMNVHACAPTGLLVVTPAIDVGDASLPEAVSHVSDDPERSTGATTNDAVTSEPDGIPQLNPAPATTESQGATDSSAAPSSVAADTVASSVVADTAPVPAPGFDKSPPTGDYEYEDVSPDLLSAQSVSPWWTWETPHALSASYCSLRRSSLSEDECVAEWACAERDYSVSCKGDGGSSWDCGCYPAGVTGFLDYKVLDQPLDAACQAAFIACTNTNPEVRVAIFSSGAEQSAHSCEWQTECEVARKSGIPEVDRLYPRTGSCVDQDGYTFCTCEGANLDRAYVVRGVTGTDACPLVQASCDSDRSPTAWEQLECQTTVVTDTPGVCEVRSDCATRGWLSAEVTALTAFTRSTQCAVDEYGRTACHCTSDAGGLNWSSLAGEVDAATCDSGLDMCERATGIEFVEPPDCGEVRSTDYVQSCAREQRCVRPGSFEGQMFTFDTLISTFCSWGSFDEWQCVCVAGETQLGKVQVTSGVDVTTACDEAHAVCQGALSFVAEPAPTPP